MKVIKNTIVFLFVLAILFLVFTIYFVKFNNRSFLGVKIKEQVLKYPKVVGLIKLNEPGDYRYYYLSPKQNNLKVNLIYGKKYLPDKDISLWIRDIIYQTTGKNVLISVNNNLDVSDAVYYNDFNLNLLRGKYVRKDLSNEPELYLFYLNTYAEKESLAGLVLHKDTIFIFQKTLDSLSENELTRSRLEKSTIMHEWGHLLGLNHVENEDCVMSEKVEVYDNSILGAYQVPDTYCKETLNELGRLRKSLIEPRF